MQPPVIATFQERPLRRVTRFLKTHGRSVEGLLFAAGSFVLWAAIGPVRWGTRPWSIDAPRAEKQPIYDALFRADVASHVLAALGVVFAVIALWRSRTRFAKIALIITVVVLLISFVP
jgi:hypothetical protein